MKLKDQKFLSQEQSKIKIHIGIQGKDYIFRLEPLTALWMETHFPNKSSQIV